MEIETRTPDEMLDGAMKRIMSIAEAVIRMSPRLVLILNEKYKYSFDKNAVYQYLSTSKDGFFHTLIRESDGAIMRATKYSESPEKI